MAISSIKPHDSTDPPKLSVQLLVFISGLILGLFIAKTSAQSDKNNLRVPRNMYNINNNNNSNNNNSLQINNPHEQRLQVIAVSHSVLPLHYRQLVVNYTITDQNIMDAVWMWITNFPAALATYGDSAFWDTSRVTNMAGIFSSLYFNGDVSHWDTSHVTNMSSMFYNAIFNGDVSHWDTSRVTDMSFLFAYASTFNGDLSNWDISKVTNMNSMFYFASSFSKIICWDVSKVTDLTSHSYGDSTPLSMFHGSKGSLDPGCLSVVKPLQIIKSPKKAKTMIEPKEASKGKATKHKKGKT